MTGASKILLLGSGGFIGSAVSEALRGRVYTAGRGKGQDMTLDLAAPIPEKIADYGFSTLIHCAGVTDEEMVSDLEGAWTRTVRRLPELLKNLKAGGLTRIIYVSSAHVYGKLDRVISEDSPANPAGQYAMAHYIAEQVVRNAGCGAVILRPATVYGISGHFASFSRTNLIPYQFADMAVRREHIVLASSGVQKLNFVDVGQIASHIARFAQERHDGAVSCYNEAGSRHISVLEYAHMVKRGYEELTGRPCGLTAGSSAAGGKDFQYVSSLEPAESMTVEEDIRATVQRIMQKSGADPQ